MKTILMAGVFSMAAIASQAETTQIYWDDLAPAPEPYENPFAGMESDQLQRLANLLRYETQSPEALDEAARNDAASLRQSLTAEGLDVDGLFEQRLVVMQAREKAANTPNAEILGQSIRLGGYVLPLEMEGENAIEFLLVPTVGACIHVPPPPANQMVHVSYPSGFAVTGLYDPVWITGEIRAEHAMRDVNYSDGASQVAVSYTMHAGAVEPYTE